MARIRSIKPGFFVSEDVSALSRDARLTWIGLWTQADDHGRTKDNTRLVKAALWSLDDDVTLDDIEAHLMELAREGRIVRYVVSGRSYLAVVNWHLHQAINRPKPSSIPVPGVATGPTDPDAPGYCRDCAVTAHASVTAGSVTTGRAGTAETGITAGQTQHGSITDEAVTQHGSNTPGGEGKGGEGRGNARAPEPASSVTPRSSPEPPRKCPEHLTSRRPPPCGACGDARREHDDWVRAQTPQPRPHVVTPCPEHPQHPAGRCPPCEAAAVPPPANLRNRTPRETA